MNKQPLSLSSILTAGVASALLAACATAPAKPDGAESLRARLVRLQSDSDLAARVPLAIKDANVAVTAAEKPQKDKVLGAHLVFMADRSISVAEALAQSRQAVDQRKALEQERDEMRLAARTQEANAANRRADVAQNNAENQAREAAAQKLAADAAAKAAADAAALAQRNAAELQEQVDALNAQATERGLVLTLGDVLFSTGGSSLNAGGTTQLAKLAVFMNKYPERTVLIEGHTDSVGSTDYNQALSQRRADSVKAFLLGQSIAGNRLTASGKGEGSPIGDNESATGRQQNRRVEVIIVPIQVSAR